MKTIEGNNDKPVKSGGNKSNTPPSIWTTTQNNSLAAPDAYKEEGNPKFISEFGRAASQGLAQIASLVKGGEQVTVKLQKAMEFMKQAQDAVSGKGDVLEKLTAVTGVSKSALQQYGVDKNNEFSKGLEKAEQLVLSVNGTYQKIKNTNFKDVNSTLNLAKDLTGLEIFSEVSGLYTQAQYTIGLVSELINQKVPNAFSYVKPLLKDNPHQTDVVTALYPKAMANGDLDSINSMTDLIGQQKMKSITFPDNLHGGLGYIGSITHTNAIEKPDFTVQDTYKAITNTYKAIQGDEFLYKDRKGNKTISLINHLDGTPRYKEILTKAAPQANEVKIPLPDDSVNDSITASDDEKYLTAAAMAQYTSVFTRLMRDFPRVVIKKDEVTIPN